MPDMKEDSSELRILTSRSHGTATVLLVLHGGKAASRAPVRSTQLTYRRMLPFARTAHRATARIGGAVWVLRNRVQGWNEPALDAVADAHRALDVIRSTHPDARIALLGHSMGARVALRLANEHGVSAVCALAPWTPDTEPVEHLWGRKVLIVHGDRDRVTPADTSLAYARRARDRGAEITRHVVSGSGHTMLLRAGQWHGHVRRFALACAEDREPA